MQKKVEKILQTVSILFGCLHLLGCFYLEIVFLYSVIFWVFFMFSVVSDTFGGLKVLLWEKYGSKYRCWYICPRDSCPRDISPRGLLSKEKLVQGDYCPRWKFETLKAVHIVFCHFIINQHRNIQLRIKEIIWTSLSLVEASLDKSLLGPKSPWTTVPWTFVPLDQGLLGHLSPGQM